jgi:hypothetical protein
MEIFLASFLIFAAVALLLSFFQRARGRPLAVGCTPENGVCCKTAGSSAPDCGARGI